MSITTELRDFVDELACHRCTRDMFREIADRIDREHEECAGFCRRLEDAASKGEEVTLFGVDYVALPLDADGVPIHLQDRMSWDNGTFDVHELKLDADGWTTWDELHGYTVRADQCRHAKPDSWERIIEDAQADGVRYHNEGKPSDFDALVERCKRLAGEVE